MAGQAAHEEDQGQEQQEDDGEEIIIVAESQHLGLALNLLVEAGHGLGSVPPLPVGAQVGEGLRHSVLPVDEGL